MGRLTRHLQELTKRGKQSKAMRKVLADPEGVAQLEKMLSSGKEGTIEINGSRYEVRRSGQTKVLKAEHE